MENKPVVKPLKLALAYALILVLVAGSLVCQLGGDTQLLSSSWVPSLNISFAFQLDGLSRLFALMISVVGALVFTYSSIYMRAQRHTTRFLTTLFCFALSMLGLVLADNVILLFIFWELTSLTSYLLIGTNNTSSQARRNALQALLITSGGGLAMFAGLLWMGIEADSFLLSDILASPEMILGSAYLTPILILIIIGCFAKSAQFPLHFWLPNAMVAPTPVSTYLHSATMVKAGIYLLARLQPVLAQHEYWTPVLATVGGITAIWASMLALKQDDLKQLLAYTTLMALGTLTFLLAFPTDKMVVAAMTFMLAHALYKATLFMVVGIIEQHAGTRNLSKLSGLAAELPVVRWIALLAALSMAGIPLFIAFIAKEMGYLGALALPHFAWPAIAVLITANALMMIAAYKVGIQPFQLFQVRPEPIKPTKPHKLLWAPAAILAILGLVFGMLPGIVDDRLVRVAATSMLRLEPNAALTIWHGFSMPLLLSSITLALGAIGIWKIPLCISTINKITQLFRWKAETVYSICLESMERFASVGSQHIHEGTTLFYVRAILSVIAASILTALLVTHEVSILVPRLPNLPDWIGVSLSTLAVTGAWMAARSNSKIIALASLGASGFAMAGIFLLHGALDVAMTQILVETLVVVLAASVLWRLPNFSDMQECDLKQKRSNIAIAGAVGLAVYLVLCSVLSQTLDLSITYFYENATFALAHGQNIVNVILVDFRAFDTLGEATVIAAAAIGVWGMTKPYLITADTRDDL